MPILSVIIPTHNPHPGRLARALDALRAQSLPYESWELLIVDNVSIPAVSVDFPFSASHFSIVRATPAGLTIARRTGILASRGDYLVFVDDDNVLAPDYLARVLAHFEANPQLGAIGGKSLPEFEQPTPSWWEPEFDGLIACRDLGSEPLFATDASDPQNGRRLYPHCAPIGAGMAVRRAALQPWLDDPQSRRTPDRRGQELTSGGDNDIVFTLLRAGWQVGYFPDLVLTHLIPAGRIQPRYLARLNRAIAKSWIHVLEKHDANPWPSISPRSFPLRQAKAWFTYRAWSSPAAHIRWQGACGHFEGRGAFSLNQEGQTSLGQGTPTPTPRPRSQP